MNVAAFNQALQEWPREVMARDAAPMQRNVLADLVNGFIDETPAADPQYRNSGKAKRGWQVFLYRAFEATERPGPDPLGIAAKTEAGIVIAGVRDKPVPLATIANPVDYIEKLANGYSKKAPAGWFERVIARVTAKYARVR